MNRVAACAALAALLLAQGCVAELKETRRRVKGPVAEVGLIDPGAGDVRYALKGPGFLVRKRRADAFKKMARYCGGEASFRVTGETVRDDVETPYNSSDLDAEKLLAPEHYKVETYRHITFECKAK